MQTAASATTAEDRVLNGLDNCIEHSRRSTTRNNGLMRENITKIYCRYCSVRGAAAAANEVTFSAQSRAAGTPRSEPVADERVRRSPQEEHVGDVIHRVHGLALAAQIHARPLLPAILVDLKQYVARCGLAMQRRLRRSGSASKRPTARMPNQMRTQYHLVAQSWH
jgi:hypothetical protein